MGDLSVDPPNLEGLGQSLRVRFTIAGGKGPYAVRITSSAEPAGETVGLAPASGAPGLFEADIQLERLFAADGSAAAIADDGKIAVYAEGDTPEDTIVVTLSGLQASATYAEPSTTVTGTVRISGQRVGGALLSLSGAGQAQSRVSRSDGSYAFYDVPPGRYTLVVARDGAMIRTLYVNVPQEES